MASGIYPRTEEHRRNLSLAWDYDKHFTKLTRENISKANTGKVRTEEHRNKYSLAKIGKSHPAWNKNLTIKDPRVKKYSENNKGKKRSEETKKKISQSKKGKFTLQNHPNWLGGKSFEPYDINFNKEFKNLVRLRDNFCCLNCGISEQKYMIISKRKLVVHHIDYNKLNTCLQNCCTLCVRCNSIANKSRNEWIEYYQEKLNKLYKYEYDKNHIINKTQNQCKEGI